MSAFDSDVVCFSAVRALPRHWAIRTRGACSRTAVGGEGQWGGGRGDRRCVRGETTGGDRGLEIVGGFLGPRPVLNILKTERYEDTIRHLVESLV